jgi:hypothetical protein
MVFSYIHVILMEKNKAGSIKGATYVNKASCIPLVSLVFQIKWIEPFKKTVIYTKMDVRLVADGRSKFT